MDTMGKRLKHLREGKDKNIKEVSQETGIGRATLYKWESDFNKPRLAELIIMAEYYGASLDYIVAAGELIGHEWRTDYPNIGECLVLKFSTPPFLRPIRPHRYAEYMPLIGECHER